eukprot:361775-Chlamydomonas_euryale.AAC.9
MSPEPTADVGMLAHPAPFSPPWCLQQLPPVIRACMTVCLQQLPSVIRAYMTVCLQQLPSVIRAYMTVCPSPCCKDASRPVLRHVQLPRRDLDAACVGALEVNAART